MKIKNSKLIGILVAVFFSFLFMSIAVFVIDSHRKTTIVLGEQVAAKDHVLVHAEAISVDPVAGIMTLRLEMLPQGKWQYGDSYFSDWAYLFVNNLEGEVEFDFDPDHPLTSVVITLHLIEGDIIMYPFDQHESEFIFELDIIEDEKYLGVPIIMEFSSNLMGYVVEVYDAYEREIDDGYLDFGISVRRTPPVIFFVGLVILMQWLLAMAALLITASALTRRTAVDIRMSSWFAAMLFALPALRRSVPEVPPLGVLYDYLSFFWVEGIVALCLAVYVLMWYFRNEK
jgi:hypothetical protein